MGLFCLVQSFDNFDEISFSKLVRIWFNMMEIIFKWVDEYKKMK